MLERVAVLSDIHAVLPALEAVLAEPDVATADRIVLTGDITAGPQPHEVLDRLGELGQRAAWISGNADREMVEHRRTAPTTASDPIVAWCAEQLTEKQLDLLAGLARTVELEIAGLGRVLFCHATPCDDEEVVVVDSALERWDEVWVDVSPDVDAVVCGHTHMPYVRLVHGRMVINPGSVGRPFGPPGAYWALLGPGVQLRRTELDTHQVQTEVSRGHAYPEAAAWLLPHLTGQITDTRALRSFQERDGRGADFQ